MARFRLTRSHKPGMSPGTLVFVGDRKLDKTRISVIDYDAEHISEKEVATIEETFGFRETASVTWINLWGIHDTVVIEALGKNFGLHPLLLEDITNTTQRPKTEDFGDYLYITLKMIFFDKEKGEATQEHLSIVVGRNFVLSFQERVGDVFDPIRNRLRASKGRIRKMGPDYLAYALVDAIVDSYFVTLETIGELIEGLEEDLLTGASPTIIQDIHRLKREMILMRRGVWPLREVVSSLERGESELIHQGTSIFLRDLYDHTIQVIDTIETYRDVISGLMDLYMSVVSNRMNEVMKVLTIIATIFIPLTFIAGIYGMNFEYMPELGWRPAYFIVWGIIVGVGAAMLLFFRRLKWL